MQIDVSFGTWQRLTAHLLDENDSYEAVIIRLLDGKSEEASLKFPDPIAHEACSEVGAIYKGVFLPHGTSLRANYKGKTFYGEIQGSDWIDLESGERRSSPSQAAYSITRSGVNGWLFWMVRRPNDGQWRSLNDLRSGIP